MSSIRVYVVLLVMLVQFQSIYSKPFFFDLLCDLFCDDDDDASTSTTTSSSTEDYFDLCDCGPTTTRRPNNGQFGPPSFNMRLPPSNGMNLSMNNTNGVWSFNLDAIQPGQNGFGFAGTPQAGAFSTGAPGFAGSTTTAGTTVAPTTAAG